MLFYFAGSMIMNEPSEECIVDFWKNGILKNLPVSSSNPKFVKAASQLRDHVKIRHMRKTLHEDYTKLFAYQKLSLAPAYESLYKRSIHVQNDNYQCHGIL